MHGAPHFMIKRIMKKEMRKMCPLANGFSNEYCDAAGEYYALMAQRYGTVEILMQK